MRQEDLFFSQLTVRETLKLAAELQLTKISSEEEKEEYVNSLLLKLGLVRLMIEVCFSKIAEKSSSYVVDVLYILNLIYLN